MKNFHKQILVNRLHGAKKTVARDIRLFYFPRGLIYL